MDEEIPTNKYDIEFVGLMKEVNSRIAPLDKRMKIKINAWLNCLMVPSKKVEWKRNRNLYLIKLIDNLINKRLDEPFDKFPPESAKELKSLSPEIIKSQLSKRFFQEIDCNKIDQGAASSPKQSVTSPVVKAKESHRVNVCSPERSPMSSSNELSSSLNGYNYKESMDKFKLESIIQVLRQRTAVKDTLIESQLKEINELKTKVTTLQKKAQIIFSYQLQKKSH